MLSRIYLPFALGFTSLSLFLNRIYECPFIVTKIIAKITDWKFPDHTHLLFLFTNDL